MTVLAHFKKKMVLVPTLFSAYSKILNVLEKIIISVLASTNDQDYESLIKSPISLVHEIALKRNMNVLFEVISEKGPAHMKTFVTKCMVGDLTATGEGNAKKVSAPIIVYYGYFYYSTYIFIISHL